MKNLLLFLKIRYWLWKNKFKVTGWKFGPLTHGKFEKECNLNNEL